MSFRSTRTSRILTVASLVGVIGSGVGIEQGLENRSEVSHECARYESLFGGYNSSKKGQECQRRADDATGLIGLGGMGLIVSVFALGAVNGAFDGEGSKKEGTAPEIVHSL